MKKEGFGINSAASWLVVSWGILAVGVSVNWETLRDDSGGKVPLTSLPAHGLPSGENNPFS